MPSHPTVKGVLLAVTTDPDNVGASDDVHRPAVAEHRATVPTRTLMLACLPAIAVGLLIRAWVMRTSLMSLNSDEGITGLQGFEVLNGRFRLVVAGNEYGATTESYVVAPLLTFWSGPWPLRVMAVLLSACAAYAIYRLAAPFYERAAAATLALIGWTTSGAIVLVWSRAYLGYPTGFIAQVAVLALAAHAIRTPVRLWRTAAMAGFAAGFAIWSHPMFGAVALLALLPASACRWRQVRQWWLPLGAGGVLGVSPWLLFIAQNGWPSSALATVQTTYPERLQNFMTELLPRAFGLRDPGGQWLGPQGLSAPTAALLIVLALGGLIVLVNRKGAQALPLLVAGVLAFPILAMFRPLGFVADARYALPFLPQLLMGLGAWLLLVPERIRRSPWLVVSIPTVWSLLLCVPILHHQIGWETQDPDQDAERLVTEIRNRHIQYLAGDYWATYLADYLADGELTVTAEVSIRFTEAAAQVNGADPTQVALVYAAGREPTLKLPRDRYQLVNVGEFDLYVPIIS
jgi:hypothetical protein